jgi:hypothetical protein
MIIDTRPCRYNSSCLYWCARVVTGVPMQCLHGGCGVASAVHVFENRDVLVVSADLT